MRIKCPCGSNTFHVQQPLKHILEIQEVTPIELRKVHLLCSDCGQSWIFTAGYLPDVDNKGYLPKRL